MWVLNEICLLNSTATPAHFHTSLAGLAVLFSRQLPNVSRNFFQTFSIFVFKDFIKNPQTTNALPFLTHNVSAIGGVFMDGSYSDLVLCKCIMQKIPERRKKGDTIKRENMVAVMIFFILSSLRFTILQRYYSRLLGSSSLSFAKI